MGRRIIPFSRLSVVFILAMILSGGTLTYFSINNISNLKELTEKRISEEHQLVSARFRAALQEKIEEVSAGFKKEVDVRIDSLINESADYDFIIQAFLLTNKGKFLFPNFSGIPESSRGFGLSERFKTAFEQGEVAEFAENELEKARGHYQDCLECSSGDLDSVSSLNALGRVSVKLGHIDDATAYYSSILLNYFHLSDKNGFPYAYYALSHLLNHANEDNFESIAPFVEFSLEKMKEGSIPMNFFTEELLSLAIDWQEKNTFINEASRSHIHQMITGIDQQIQFLNQYRKDLSEMVKSRGADAQYTDSSGFEIINSLSENNREFFLMYTGIESTSGLLIDRNDLFDAVSNSGLQDGLEFEYIIEFPSGYTSNTAANKLSYSSQLLPYFPGQTMRVKLQNEDLIDDLINRRSWIYGIASVLLLLAMLLGVVLILRDIAREKRLAKLRSEFVSNVTHELKTPLTSIRMYAESLMMKRVKSESGRMKYLSVVVNESERLKRMINNILEFSKVEKDRQEYHPVESNASEILQTAVSDMNYWLEKEGFNMITEIEKDIKVKVDPEKFYLVYSNLLSNAIKYSGDSRKIYVRLYKNSGSVITEIEDEGIGIEIDTQTRIFEEFYRVENHGAGNATGTGLGLTVVKEIVEAHQGKIELESEIGKGSKFSVILFQN